MFALVGARGVLLGWATAVAQLPDPPANSIIRELPEWETAPPAPWVWSPDVLNWRVPSRSPVISRQTFMDRIGDAAVVSIQMASWGTSREAAQLRAWLLRYQVVGEIDVSDVRTIAGVDALIAAGLIDANDREAILSAS